MISQINFSRQAWHTWRSFFDGDCSQFFFRNHSFATPYFAHYNETLLPFLKRDPNFSFHKIKHTSQFLLTKSIRSGVLLGTYRHMLCQSRVPRPQRQLYGIEAYVFKIDRHFSTGNFEVMWCQVFLCTGVLDFSFSSFYFYYFLLFYSQCLYFFY